MGRRVGGAAVLTVLGVVVTALAMLGSQQASGAAVRQRAALSAPAAVRVQTTLTVRAAFTPVRPGRRALLQRRVGSRWVKVAAGRESAAGRVALRLRFVRPGTVRLRVLAVPAKGLPQVASPVRTVLVKRPLLERVSTSSSGGQADGASAATYYRPSISADGRYVAFTSDATNLVPGDTNGVTDVFVKDTWTHSVERVSVATDGTQGTEESVSPAISADGRFVVYSSASAQFGDQSEGNTVVDVFRHDRKTDATVLVSTPLMGGGTAQSEQPSVSGDGNLVAFTSAANNLVVGDTNGKFDVFVRNMTSGTTTRVSVSSGGAQGDKASSRPSISANGDYVAFQSDATTLVANDTNNHPDVFLRSLTGQTTERVTQVRGTATQGDGNGFDPSISATGRYVAFTTDSTNLTPDDPDGWWDILVWDRSDGSFEVASHSTAADFSQQGEVSFPSISADGSTVAFRSSEAVLAPGDTNGFLDIYVSDLDAGTIKRVSDRPGGVNGNADSTFPALAGNGLAIAFASDATNLVVGDTNGVRDVFLRRLD
ncbi:TolB family protein [Nocardioides sp.]|uniref:TolB family protein n=1 Tax=Nocardioides sp. TaxID=35761 RepID=UPI003783B772